MKKKLIIIVFLLLCIAYRVSAEGTEWLEVPEVAQLGQEITLTYSCAEPEDRQIAILDVDGETVLTLLGIGTDSFRWKVTGLEAGSYTLRLSSGELSSDTVLMITGAAPEILNVDAEEELTTGWEAHVTVNREGILSGHLEDGTAVISQMIEAGTTTCTFDFTDLSAGSHELSLRLTGSDGSVSDVWAVDLLRTVPSPATDVTFLSPDSISGITCSHANCYWNLPMGEMREEDIWQVLIQPVTVLSGSERNQYKVRKEPDKNCTTYTGAVTYESQAVHVLERGEKWTLIEAYSSCVEGSSVKVWAKQFTGYVETKLLKEKQVSQDVGIVIDKLQQRLYVFREGKLFSTLLCSTGYATSATPFNETPAGEFLAISWTGGFWSGNLFCDMAIRINDGILLHEVPCLIETAEDGTQVRRYERCERYLGEKASHGCIRIQRVATPEGVNAKWLWENLPRTGAPCKVIIWDDVGRTLGYPDDDYPLYYNPNGGKYYHSDPNCASVKQKYWPLTAFTYSQLLEKPYSKLTRCPACTPQLSHKEIDELNAQNRR